MRWSGTRWSSGPNWYALSVMSSSSSVALVGALGVLFWLVDMALAWGAKHVTGQGG